MNLTRILTAIHGEPWMITPRAHAAVASLVQRKLEGQALDLEDFVVRRPAASVDRDGIGHVYMSGVLGRRLSNVEKTCGACDYDDLADEMRQMAGRADALILHADSPGGMATGNAEAAAAFAALGIPTMVHIDGMAASAAYMIAAGADLIVASPSASVGSIGVLIPWVDKSARWQAFGLDYRPIISEGADLKGAGYGPSLTDDQIEHLQQEVDDLGQAFRAHIETNRAVDPEVFRAGSYRGERALAMGLIDAVGTEDEAREALLLRLRG